IAQQYGLPAGRLLVRTLSCRPGQGRRADAASDRTLRRPPCGTERPDGAQLYTPGALEVAELFRRKLHRSLRLLLLPPGFLRAVQQGHAEASAVRKPRARLRRDDGSTGPEEQRAPSRQSSHPDRVRGTRLAVFEWIVRLFPMDQAD